MRSIKIFFALALFLLSQAATPSYAETALPKNGTIADAFVGEELVYEIGFWFFEEVAIGKISLEKGENGEFVATLTAYTTGIVDKFVKHRKDIYVSRLKLSPDGKRFLTKSFEKSVTIGDDKHIKSSTVFDYGKMTMTWKSTKNGKETSAGIIDLPKDKYSDDPLGAFYNFRYGVYGPHEAGREYTIYSFPKEDHVPKISLKIDSKEKSTGPGKKGDFLASARIDKELFGSQAGDIDIVFTDDMLPIEAVAKELLFFGDVRGRLKKYGAAVEFKKTSAASAP